MTDHNSRAGRFERLCSDAAACSLCPGMVSRSAVLSPLNGSLQPKVLFIAEAPGRRGADRTRIPMSGDSSGRTFRHLLQIARLQPNEVFITNAILCSPRSDTGANRSPRATEIRSCSPLLRRTIEEIDPPIVVTIGGKALCAVSLIEPHSLTLAANVCSAHKWFGRTLVPLYHPSPQVLISRRSLAQQEEDWKLLAFILQDHRT